MNDLSPRQRQTLKARTRFLDTLSDPSARREHFAALAARSKGRVVLSAREAAALRQAIAAGDPGDAAAWRSLLGKLMPGFPAGGEA